MNECPDCGSTDIGPKNNTPLCKQFICHHCGFVFNK